MRGYMATTVHHIKQDYELKSNDCKEDLNTELNSTDTVNATVYICSVRKMRGYMATTVHYIK